jgi:hypothetical protein
MFNKFIIKVCVEESIVNTPLVTRQNQNSAKSEVTFKQVIRGAITIDFSTPTLRIDLNEHPIFFAKLILCRQIFFLQIFPNQKPFSLVNFFPNAIVPLSI